MESSLLSLRYFAFVLLSRTFEFRFSQLLIHTSTSLDDYSTYSHFLYDKIINGRFCALVNGFIGKVEYRYAFRIFKYNKTSVYKLLGERTIWVTNNESEQFLSRYANSALHLGQKPSVTYVSLALVERLLLYSLWLLFFDVYYSVCFSIKPHMIMKEVFLGQDLKWYGMFAFALISMFRFTHISVYELNSGTN